MAATYSVGDSPLGPPVDWRLDAGDLVRRTAKGERRWPLADLTRLTLIRHPNRYGPDLRVAQLRFGRRRASIASLGWRGVGRRSDQTAAFAAFVRRLAAEAADVAPRARFQTGGRPTAAAGLYWIAALIGASLLALTLVALSARQIGLGLDFGARLLFVFILLFAVAPWLPGASSGDFDPRAVPDHLAPGA